MLWMLPKLLEAFLQSSVRVNFPIEVIRVMGLINGYGRTPDLTEVEERLHAFENA